MREQERPGPPVAAALCAAVAWGAACVSGSGEERPAEPSRPAAPERVAQRPEFEELAHWLRDSDNPYMGERHVERLRGALADPALDAPTVLRLRTELTLALLNAGDTEAALVEADRMIGMLDPAQRSKVAARLHQLRALVHLRRAEVQNCLRRGHAESCIFPLERGGLHLLREPAESAKRDYQRALEIDPTNLEPRWLLNIVHMALDEYPDRVPPEYLLPPAAFESEQEVGHFPNIASRLGLDTFDLAGGAIVEDFDRDGRLDVVSSTADPRGPLHHFRNRGDGSFEDVSRASRLDDQLGGLNCLAADFDNDGRRDVLVLRGAWLHEQGRIRNSLLRNDPDGVFTDVTRAAGLADPARPTQAAAWADLDNDGDLDLYVGNESRVAPGDPEHHPSQLFRNNGDGTFTDVAREAGVTNDRFCKGLAAGDHDNDGDIDLYLSNIGPNRLYRNDGGLAFTDVAGAAGVTEPVGRSFATWFFDYDNDGWLDLFVAGYRATTADLAAQALGRPHTAERARLYRNAGDGTFDDVTSRVGLDGVYLAMGANFGDLDNDGWLDIYLGTGEPDYQALMPNVMLRNDAARRFVDVSESGGFGHLQKGHGVAFADLDDDGDQDVYHQLGGFYAGDKARSALFLNPGHRNRFLCVELVGRQTNRDAMGARIRVVVADRTGRRELHRAVGSVSSFGGSPIRQEIGLGSAERLLSVEVDWPRSGTRSVVERVPLDAMIRIVEGEPGFELVERRPLDLLGDPG